VERVEQLIRADRKITLDTVATAQGCSQGLVYNIMHDHLKFREVCSLWVPRKLKDREKIPNESLLAWSLTVCRFPNDFHLFGPLKIHLGRKILLTMNSLKRMRGSGGDDSQKKYCTGFDALVKRWDKCINVGGGYIEI
ncbi:hypothetical protein B7P43_G07423, partial [Cryptotermes secundus]